MISEELIEEIATDLRGKKVSGLRIRLGYTAVRLDSDETGLAGTLHYDLPRGCSLLDRAGDFEGTDAAAAELPGSAARRHRPLNDQRTTKPGPGEQYGLAA